MPAPAPEQPQNDRRKQQRVRHLREGRHAEQHRGDEIAARAEQPPAATRRGGGGGDLLVEPAEIRDQSQREVEELRRNPHVVHRHDGGHHKSACEDGRDHRPHARLQEDVAAERRQRQQQGVEHQEAVRSEQPHERRGDERIDERLAVEVAGRIRIGPRRRPEERRPEHQPGLHDVAALLQEQRRSAPTGIRATPARGPRADRSGRRPRRGCAPSCNRSPRRSGCRSRRAENRRSAPGRRRCTTAPTRARRPAAA